jgi:hypothetical protein
MGLVNSELSSCWRQRLSALRLCVRQCCSRSSTPLRSGGSPHRHHPTSTTERMMDLSTRWAAQQRRSSSHAYDATHKSAAQGQASKPEQPRLLQCAVVCFLHHVMAWQASQKTLEPLPYVYSVAKCLFIALLLVFALVVAARRTSCCSLLAAHQPCVSLLSFSYCFCCDVQLPCRCGMTTLQAWRSSTKWQLTMVSRA